MGKTQFAGKPIRAEISAQHFMTDTLSPIAPKPAGGMIAANALCMVSMISWAAGFPAADHLLKIWDPLALATARFLVALCVLIPLWAMIDGPRRLLRARWGKGAVIGGLAFGLGAYLLLLAQALTDAVTVAIIAASSPIAATLIEMVWEKRRLRLPFAVGLAASIIGGIIATGSAPHAQLGLGAAVAIVSCFLFAWGSWATVRFLPDLSPLGRTSVTLSGGLIVLAISLLGGIAFGLSDAPAPLITGADLGALLVYAIFGMAISQLLLIMSVGRMGVAVAAFHINISPFYVMVILFALGAAWSWPQFLGAAVVGLGVLIAQR